MASDIRKKAATKNSEGKLTVSRFVGVFKKFSPADQIKIAEQINRQLFADRWILLDAALPDIDISEEEVMAELIAVRKNGREEAH